MSAQDLALFLRLEMGRRNIKNVDIARKANISRRTWYRLLDADIQEAKLSTLIKVANALDTTVTELLQIYFEGKSINSERAKSSMHSTSAFLSSDVNFPVNSLVSPGEVFTKVWQVVNRSPHKRTNLILQCLDDQVEVKMMRSGSGEMLKPQGLTPDFSAVPIEDLESGETLKVSVTFKAPATPCTTVSHWGVFENGVMLSPKDLPYLNCQVRVVQPQ